MEKYCVFLEIAKKFKELGVKQESEWYWVLWEGLKYQLINEREFESHGNKIGDYAYYSAFTVGELGEILPEKYTSWKADGKWKTSILNNETTEANARGKMLIYLIENKLMEVE